MICQQILPPSAAPEPLLAHQLRVVVGFVRGGPADASVQPGPGVSPPPVVKFLTEMAERSVADPPDELLGEDSVEPLELSSIPGVVGSPVDHGDTPNCAVCSKLLGDEATPVVDVESLGLAATLEPPPEVVRGRPGLSVKVGAGHHEVPGPIVEDGVDVDVPTDPADSELLDVHLPEGVDVAALEPLERLRLLDESNHEPVALQDPVDRDPAHLDAPAPKDGMNPQGPPSGVPSPEMEDAIDEVTVDVIRAVARTPGLVSGPSTPSSRKFRHQ